MPLLVREAKLDDIPIIYKYIKDFTAGLLLGK